MPKKGKMIRRSAANAKCNSASTKGTPFFDEVFTTLAYTETINTNASVGLFSYSYCHNDVYDPNFTGAGGQPMGFDQWMSIYSRFAVVSSEIEVTATSRTVSGLLECAVVPVPTTSPTPASFEAASAMRYAKKASTTGGAQPPLIRSAIDTASLFGVPDYAIQGDTNWNGTSASSPPLRSTWAIVCETSGASDALSLSVRIKYRVRLWLPFVATLSATRRSAIASAETVTLGGHERVVHGRPGLEPVPARVLYVPAASQVTPSLSMPSGPAPCAQGCACKDAMVARQ